MKDCPFCSEKVHEQAKKCKHCGEWLKPQSWGDKLNSVGNDFISMGYALVVLALVIYFLMVIHVK